MRMTDRTIPRCENTHRPKATAIAPTSTKTSSSAILLFPCSRSCAPSSPWFALTFGWHCDDDQLRNPQHAPLPYSRQ